MESILLSLSLSLSLSRDEYEIHLFLCGQGLHYKPSSVIEFWPSLGGMSNVEASKWSSPSGLV